MRPTGSKKAKEPLMLVDKSGGRSSINKNSDGAKVVQALFSELPGAKTKG